MAFGDVIQSPAFVSVAAAKTITATWDQSPVSGNLLIATFGTGAAMADVNTPSGWSRSDVIDNTTENDAGVIFYKEADGAEVDLTVTTASTDELALKIMEFEGPWRFTPTVLDLEEAEARQASGTTYVTAPTSPTGFDDELAISFVYTRDDLNEANGSWSNSFVEFMDNATPAKSWHASYKVLSSIQSVSTALTFTTDAISTGGMATFIKQVTTVDVGARVTIERNRTVTN